ncbi:MAG: hypothetical protein M1299_07890 [Firmicutes bacterium]|nr:hypothetical protein [Bacillota bacterium]MCL5039722.1 hypothetical protein [Bacillota bacterium]
MSMSFATWLGALATLAVYSFLYKPNKIFSFFEHIYVGVGAGYGIVFGYNAIVRQGWEPMLKGKGILIVPMILGVLLFTRFFKSVNWVSRLPLAFLVGLGAALSMKAIESDFLVQIRATMIPWSSLNSILLVLGTVSALAYFFFTFPDNKAVRSTALFGRWFLMAAFGAAFGNAVMGRISLVIGELQFLFKDWIHLIK